MPDFNTCPECGQAIGPGAPRGLCPKCLVDLGVPESTPDPGQAASTATPATGQRFGEYEVLEELGRGGMGQVWRARQPRLGREVALKVIVTGPLASAAQISRFKTEAEAVAGLDHPHIVPIYEFGEWNGQHYFAMKWIEGGSVANLLSTSAAAAKAGDGPTAVQRPQRRDGHVAVAPRRAAELVAAVARATHHAHQRGIIHRDLKPSNILLDSDGRPHVSDFGLAKRLSLDDADPALTHSGDILGTPNYMAPEQAAGKSRDVTTAADVYALGAILYHLLCGRPPFVGANLLEIMRQVVEERPRRPSTILRKVDADLETICLKCLEKNPGQRYASAAALADDLERWLRREPIAARRVGVLTRMVKWARRKPAIAAMALLLLACLGGAYLMVFLQLKQTETLERSRAEVANFLSAALRPPTMTYTNEEGGLEVRKKFTANEWRAEDLLDDARRKLTNSSSSSNAIGAMILDAIANSFDGLDLPKKAIAAHVTALKIRQEVLGPDHTNTLASMNSLALAYHSAGQLSNSIALYEEALTRHRARFGPDHPETLAVMNNLASAYMDDKRTADGLRLQEEAVRGLQLRLGTNHSRTLSAMNSLAAGYREARQPTNAVRLHREVLRLRGAASGPDHPDTLQSMNNLALALEDIGQTSEAIALLQATLERRLRIFGTNHTLTALSQHNLANAYFHAEDLTNAIDGFEVALATYRRALPPDHPDLLRCMNNLSTVYIRAGRVTNAIALQEETVGLYRTNLSESHPRTLTAMNNLAEAYGDALQWTNAIRVHEQVLAIKRARFGTTNRVTLDSIFNLAAVYEQAGQLPAARALAEESLTLHTNLFDPGHLFVADAYALLARVLLRSKDYSGAEQAALQARDIRRAKRPGYWSLYNAESLRGEALQGLGRMDEAEKALLDGYQGMKAPASRLPPRARPQVEESVQRLIRFYQVKGADGKVAEWTAKLEEERRPK